MLNVSESACDNLSKLLSDSGAPDGACVRFIL
jgi:hypothetical protein